MPSLFLSITRNTDVDHVGERKHNRNTGWCSMVQLAKGLAYKYEDPSSVPRFLKRLGTGSLCL